MKIKTPFSCFFVVVGFVPVSFYKLKSLKLEVVIHEESMQVMILLLKYSPNLEVLKLWSDEVMIVIVFTNSFVENVFLLYGSWSEGLYVRKLVSFI